MQRAAQPTYQQGLGAIGRYLDQHGYDSLVLCELTDGFVVRAVRGDNLAEAIPFPMSDMHNLVRQVGMAARTGSLAAPAPVLDGSFLRRVLGGYREFLAAFGRQCDQLEASTVLVMELPDAVLVSYQKVSTTYEAWEASTYEYIYNEQGVRRLVMGSAFTARR